MTNFITDDLINANARCIFTLNTTAPVGSGGTFDFTSEVFQSGGFTSSSGDIFVPSDGMYYVSWRVSGISNVGVNGQTNASINNTGTAIAGRSSSGGSDGRSLDGKGYVTLVKGDAVRIKMVDVTFPSQNSGASESYFSIVRVADYSAGEPAGFGLATETQAGLNFLDLSPVTNVLSSNFAGTSPATEMTDLRHTGLVAGDKYRVDITLLTNTGQAHIWVAWGDRSDSTKYRYHRVFDADNTFSCTFEFISDGNDLRVYGGPSGTGFTAQDGNDTPTELTGGPPKVTACVLTRVKNS